MNIKRIIREEIENDFDDFFIMEEEAFNGQYVFDPPITRKEWADKVLPALDKFHIENYDRDGWGNEKAGEGIHWCCQGNIKPSHIPSDFEKVTRIFSVDIDEGNVLRTMAKPHWSYDNWLEHMKKEKMTGIPIHNGRLVFGLEDDLPKKSGWIFESDGFLDSNEKDWEWTKGDTIGPLSDIPYEHRGGQTVMINPNSEYYHSDYDNDVSNPNDVEGKIYSLDGSENYEGGLHYMVKWGKYGGDGIPGKDIINSYSLEDLVVVVKNEY